MTFQRLPTRTTLGTLCLQPCPPLPLAHTLIGSVPYATGFRGLLFMVDDNFIGNKRAAKQMLPVLAEWIRTRGFPFDMYTEASINLAADARLIELMVQAGFSSVFIGLETPSQDSLAETQKIQNMRLDLTKAVEKLTGKGLEVMAGFIVGFDADDEGIFEQQLAFIQNAPIPLAMVGILSALPGSQLWRRLEREQRLIADWSGESFGRTNFETRLPADVLLTGYTRLLSELYEPDAYFARCLRVLKLWPSTTEQRFGFPLGYALRTLLRVVWRMGVKAPYRVAFWHFLVSILRTTPRLFARGIAQAVNGEHVIRFTCDDVIPRLTAEQHRAKAPEVNASPPKRKMPSHVVPASFAKSAESSRLAQLRRSVGSEGLKL